MNSLSSEFVKCALHSRAIAMLACTGFLALATSAVAAVPARANQLAKVDATLAALPSDEQMVEVLIALPAPLQEGASIAISAGMFGKTSIVASKRASHERAARDVVAWLDARGYRHRSYWIASALWARVPAREVNDIAARVDVRFLSSNPAVRGIEPQLVSAAGIAPKAINAIEWGIDRIRAPEAWATGVFGQGAVVAGADTGYQWDHPALKNQYRGWNAQTQQSSHAYNWHDAIHQDNPSSPGANSCGFDRSSPCDDNSHGTHTMGSMVGNDGGTNQIGVAPQAKWIGCRNMEEGWGTPTTYIECMQFFAAPTDAQGNNPRADLAPHVVNNSWGCPAVEGCTPQTDVLMATAIANLRDLGILFVVSAGNAGSACGTVADPPATLELSFTVGATSSGAADPIAEFSSRGPVGSRLAPTISAPGVSIRSSVPNNAYASFNGTSMAGPHVAGAVALMISGIPALASDPTRLRSLLEGTAVPRTSAQNCGAFLGSSTPNAVYGYGRLDVKAALDAAAQAGLFLDGFEGQ